MPADPLPKAARTALQTALRAKSERVKREAYRKAFQAVAYPEGDRFPLPDELTKPQRALALAFAEHHTEAFDGYAIPYTKAERRRWLGLEEGGELERTTRGVPMWRRLQEVRDDERATHRLVDALPMPRRLALHGEIFSESFRAAYNLEDRWFAPRRLFPKLRAEGKKWAPAYADHLVTQEPRRGHEGELLRYLVFLALVRAKVAIKPAWDVLFPVGIDDRLSIECARALPEPRRALAAAAALAHHVSSYTVDYALALLRAFPSAELTRAVYELGRKGRLPHQEAVKAIRVIGKKHPIVATTLAALLAEAEPAPALRCTSIVKLTNPAKLTSVERMQLERAGRRYDGRKLTAAQWLTPEKRGEEPTFAGRIELAQITDADGCKLYDIYEYMGDSGTIFKAKTGKEVGAIIQGSMSVGGDAALREAIRAALHDYRRRKKK